MSADNQTNLMALWMHLRKGTEVPLRDSHVTFTVTNGTYSAKGLSGTVKGSDGHTYEVLMRTVSPAPGKREE